MMILRCGPWLAALTSLFLAMPAAAQTLTFTGDVGGACVGSEGGPGGVAVDPRSANIVVSLPEVAQVCILDPSGNQLGVLTQSDGVTPFPFLTPLGVAIDPDTGRIVVADAGDGETPNSGSVTVFDTNGVVLPPAAQLTLANGDSFDTPSGVAIDASLSPTHGQVVVVDPSFVTISPAIRAFNAINPGDAIASRNGGAPGSGQILDPDVDEPYDVAIDGAGNVWFGDVSDGAVEELSPSLTNLAFLTIPGETSPIFLPGPASIAFDPEFGNLAVADVEGDQALVIFFSAPGAPFTPSASAVRRQSTESGLIARARAALPPAQHRAAAAGRSRSSRLKALAAAAQRRHAAKPACGCGPVTLVVAAPLLLTNGAFYASATSAGSPDTGGGQAFFEDPGASPPFAGGFLPLFTVTYRALGTVLVGDEGGEPLQLFNLINTNVPTLGGVAALGFAALLGMTALTQLRRRSVER